MLVFSKVIKIDVNPETKQKLYESAIKAVGSKRKLAKIICYGYRNIDEWVRGNQDSIGLNIFKQLCDITSISLNDLQESIIKIKTGKAGYFLKFNFPFKIFNRDFIELLVRIFGEGTVKLGRISKTVCYYNTDVELINKVRKLSNDLFHPQKSYAIRKIYASGDEIKCPNNKKILARKDELSLSLPNFIAYVVMLHCNSLKEFKTVGISNLILQVPDSYIHKIIGVLIEDEGCVRPDCLVIFTTKYKIVADAIKIRFDKLHIKASIQRQGSFYDLVISNIRSLKSLKSIDIYDKKLKRFNTLMEILSMPKANYFEVDKEILQFLKINRNNRYTATDVAWNIKRRKWVVGSALQRLCNKNSIKKENNPDRYGSYLYCVNNIQCD